MSKGKHYFEQQIKHRDGKIKVLQAQVKALKSTISVRDAEAHALNIEAQEWARKYRAEIHKQKTDKKATKA